MRGRGHGGRGWRRAGHGEAQVRRITRYLEPCLLYLLNNSPLHGYELIDGLDQFGFDSSKIDPSVIYRILRDLEADGLAVSEWDTSGSGAPRRVYTVTREGLSHLEWWVSELRETRDGLTRFLEMIDTKTN